MAVGNKSLDIPSHRSQRCLHFPQILPLGSRVLLYSLLQVTQGNEVSMRTLQNVFSPFPSLTSLLGFALRGETQRPMQDLALPHHFCCGAPSDSHPTPSWTFALLGTKWLSENLPSRRFILPRRMVVKVALCPLPCGHSFARKAWERALRDERHERLGLLSTGLRSLNVGFISPN